MPVYKAKVFLRDTNLLGDQEYTFNAHVQATTTLNAWERANEIAESLVGTVMPPNVFAYRVGISNPDVVNGSLYKNTTLQGTRVVTGDALPGWNVIEYQVSVAEGVRPHTFFIRMGLTENDVTGQVLAPAVDDAISSFNDAFLLTGANVDKDGFAFIIGTWNLNVRMRQMGWRRRTRPGFKRGWVPA